MNTNKEWIDSTFEKIDNKLKKVSIRSRYKLPYSADENGVHTDKNVEMNWWWTNGFWGGLMWLMYTETKNEDYKITAEESCKMVNKIFENYNHLDHDVGFIWHLTSFAKYRLTGCTLARSTALLAAATLASRFYIDAKFIRAWNMGTWKGLDTTKVSIIDTVMNLPLLYRAADETKNQNFRRIAQEHMDMTIKQHIRPDGSVYHQVVHNIETGEFEEGLAGQGYSSESCWSRGLAWAIYGSVISYIHTNKKEYLDAATKTANYFIEHVKKTDYVAPADFLAPKENFVYDSTASACAACGLLEIAKYVSPDEATMYEEAAIKMLRTIDEKFANYDENIDYLVGYGSERCPREGAVSTGYEIPIIYGDFFYVEALLKLRQNDFFIW